MTSLSWTLNEDPTTVTVTLPTVPPTTFVWTASTMDQHLQILGEFRANMKPTIPQTWALGQTFAAIPDPAWATETDATMRNSVLHFRDPRFGWLHYLLPKEEVRKLAGYLQKQMDALLPA